MRVAVPDLLYDRFIKIRYLNKNIIKLLLDRRDLYAFIDKDITPSTFQFTRNVPMSHEMIVERIDIDIYKSLI